MPQQDLLITIIQADIVWEDKTANLQHYETLIASIEGKKEVVILPEMFSTGFSMSPERLAETMDGTTVGWMRKMAAQHNIILCGSIIIEEDSKFYNRMVWMQPNGECGTYDKRHLFAFAGEDAQYNAGSKRLIVQVKGWRLYLLICYDLRFPVWARQNNNGEAEYDAIVYVANWPQQRSHAWKTLLLARAIENQSYVVGVNRVGADINNNQYTGDSAVIDPMGNIVWSATTIEAVRTVQLQHQQLNDCRERLPFLRDSDKFILL
jgi:predicted amidohydrolase